MTASRAHADTVDVLGIPVARLTLHELLRRIAEAARRPPGAPLRVAYVNAHSVNLFLDDAAYRDAMRAADLVYADGNGPRLAAWLAGDHLPPRMTGADWIHDLCRLAEREDMSLYFLGARPGVAEEAARRLLRRWPRLRIVGMHHGFFEEVEEKDVLREIEALRPSIVLLAMGSPRQEIWMSRRAAGLCTGVVWAAGGVLDYASGRVRRAPWLMRRLGLEWLGRALIEPRRLGGRYLVGIPRFLWRAALYAAARPSRR